MRTLLITVGLIISSTVFAQQNTDQQSYRFSLVEAENYAVKNSYSVVDKELEYQKAKKYIAEVASAGMPQVSFAANYNYNYQIARQPVPAQIVDPNAPEGEFIAVAFGVENQTNASLAVNQLILDGSYFVALRASAVLKNSALIEKEQSIMNIRNDAAKSYYGVLISQETEKIVEENLATLEANLKEISKLYEGGFSEEQDVDQLELLVNNLQNSLDYTRRQTVIARQLFKFTLGIPLEKEVILTDGLQEVSIPIVDNMVLAQDSFSYENHVDYRLVENQFQGAELNVANEKMNYLPKLSAFYNHTESNFGNDGFNAFEWDRYWIPSSTLGLSLNFELLRGLQGRSARVQQAKIEKDRSMVALDLTKNQLKLEYERAKTEYQYALANYKNRKRNVDIAKSIRDKTITKYKAGLASSLDLTQTENQYLDAQSQLVSAMLNILNAKEEFERALGK